jgi:hypothetical protein
LGLKPNYKRATGSQAAGTAYIPLRPQTTIAIEKVKTLSNEAQPSVRISIAVPKKNSTK